ncbi:MAG: hypothetical protein AAF713_22345 [Pseudomonadota bacterium]
MSDKTHTAMCLAGDKTSSAGDLGAMSRKYCPEALKGVIASMIGAHLNASLEMSSGARE